MPNLENLEHKREALDVCIWDSGVIEILINH